MTEENKNKIKDVAKYWGNTMPIMAMEEAGELIQAISKYERNLSDEEKQNLIDEIGDMFISLHALIEHYDIDSSKVKLRIGKKLNKRY